MSRVASVVLEKTSFSYDKLYDYVVPASVACCSVGCRVTVPFGRGDVLRQGIVLEMHDSDFDANLKQIVSVEDAQPVISNEMVQLCHFLRERTFCTYFDAVRCMLPPGLGLKLKKAYYVTDKPFDNSNAEATADEIYRIVSGNPGISEKKLFDALGLLTDNEHIKRLINEGYINSESYTSRKVNDASMLMARLADGYDAYNATERQQQVISMLLGGPMSIKELMYYSGASRSVISTLEKHSVIEVFEQEYFRAPYSRGVSGKRTNIELNCAQQTAFDGLLSEYKKPEASVSLLYGVTGSGKTSVYLKLVDEALKDGRNVIVMVPEISLTPQTIKIFSDRYGDDIALFHSAMSMGQRLDEWKRVKNGMAHIAIGTRSAVFAPFENIGLIIIDEEQEHTYKSEQSPRFDARDVAKFRANKNNALLVFASATPSVETYSAAREGRYSLFLLNKRYSGQLPKVVVVDMKKEILSGNKGCISSVLYDNINSALENDKQAIILLNRRGHNSFVSCPTCSSVETCPNCSISLTYHSANKRLMCHYCGYSAPFTGRCSVCSADNVRLMGMGTQLVEEELSALFPSARILRMDADSTLAHGSYSSKLRAFADGEYDIMLGTQMVAKGLDFPRVSLVGVIGADQAMHSNDYRTYERTFSLLTQVVGRSGRSDDGGVAVIQTVSPDSTIISLAAEQDFNAFYENEILSRKLMIYPPYCNMAVLVVSSEDANVASDVCFDMFEAFKQKIASYYSDVRLVILGPAQASIIKVGGKYRYRMIIKCKNNRRFRDLIREVTREVDARNRRLNYSYYVDIDPERIP